MNVRRRTYIRSAVGAAIALVSAAAPASAAASSSPAPAACLLAPGVYGITDSSGGLVGILIVYPDCRMEVVKRPAIT